MTRLLSQRKLGPSGSITHVQIFVNDKRPRSRASPLSSDTVNRQLVGFKFQVESATSVGSLEYFLKKVTSWSEYGNLLGPRRTYRPTFVREGLPATHLIRGVLRKQLLPQFYASIFKEQTYMTREGPPQQEKSRRTGLAATYMRHDLRRAQSLIPHCRILSRNRSRQRH